MKNLQVKNENQFNHNKKKKSDSEILFITSLTFYSFRFQILPEQFQQQLEKIIFGSTRFLSTTVYGDVATQLRNLSYDLIFVSFLNFMICPNFLRGRFKKNEKYMVTGFVPRESGCELIKGDYRWTTECQQKLWAECAVLQPI